jgi:hypothetical protein
MPQTATSETMKANTPTRISGTPATQNWRTITILPSSVPARVCREDGKVTIIIETKELVRRL